MEYKMKYVMDHVEVYDYKGKFLFSSDTEREARLELSDLTASKAA